MAFTRHDGSTAKLIGNRLEITVGTDPTRTIIPLDKVDRRRIGEMMRSMGFSKV